MNITNEYDQTTIDLRYNSSQVATITSTLGPRLDFEYNSAGLVDVVILSAEELQPRVAR